MILHFLEWELSGGKSEKNWDLSKLLQHLLNLSNSFLSAALVIVAASSGAKRKR